MVCGFDCCWFVCLFYSCVFYYGLVLFGMACWVFVILYSFWLDVC